MCARSSVNAAFLGGALGLLGTLIASWFMPATSFLWVVLQSISEGSGNRELGISWEEIAPMVPYLLLGIGFVFALAAVPGTIGAAFLGVGLRLMLHWRGHISPYVGAISGLALGGLVGLGVDRITRVLLGGPPSVNHFDPIDAAALSLAMVFGGTIGAILTWLLQRGHDAHCRDNGRR